MDCVKGLWEESREKGEQESGYNFLVSREGERVLGYACFGPRALTRGAYDLFWIAVDPAAQGQGVGRGLMERVEAEVKALGGNLLIIETSDAPHYTSTRRFYEVYGCDLEATIRDFYAPGEGLFIYTRHL